MSFVGLISGLYAVGGVAAALFYLPQILRLLRSAEARRAMALVTWGGWIVVGTVTLLYAAVVVRQAEMVLVVSLNLTCQVAVFGLAVWQRFADRRGRARLAP